MCWRCREGALLGGCELYTFMQFIHGLCPMCMPRMRPWMHRLAAHTTETNNILLVLFGMQNRTLRP
jgi:hypothetical protein